MDNKIFVRYVVRESVGILGMGAALFWSAGTLHWWQAWAVLLIMLVWSIATAVVILRSDPSLLAERLGPRKGAKRWDTVIMSVLGLVQLARYRSRSGCAAWLVLSVLYGRAACSSGLVCTGVCSHGVGDRFQ